MPGHGCGRGAGAGSYVAGHTGRGAGSTAGLHDGPDRSTGRFRPDGKCRDQAAIRRRRITMANLDWSQCLAVESPPLVDKYKWLEPRHMVNISDRWNRDKTSDLQFAFFNGVGWESWENIWGIWNGITPRDAEATRRVATIEHA